MPPNADNTDVDHHAETSPDGRYVRYNAVLGKGAYKTVYKAFDTEEALEVAWNKLHVDRLSEHDLEKVSNEVILLRSVEHKNIIHFYDTWLGDDSKGTRTINFITEQMMSGTLKEYFKKAKAIKLKVIRRWCRNILEAVAYLHSQQPPIMHRDLKCDNIFINGHVGEVKIGDLGLSGVKDRDKAESVIGTPEFMAPELYEESYTEKVDIYAFGMCLLEMVTMEYPYSECSNMAQIFKKVFQGEKPKAFSMLEEGPVKDVIAACLQREEKRPSAARLLEHPLFKDWEKDEGKSSNLSIVKGPHTAVENAISFTTSYPLPIGAEVIDWALNRSVFVSMVEGGQTVGEGHELLVIADNDGGPFNIGLEIPIGDAVKRVEFSFDPFHDSSQHIAQEMVTEFGLEENKLSEIQELIEAQVNLANRQREEASRNAATHPLPREMQPEATFSVPNESSSSSILQQPSSSLQSRPSQQNLTQQSFSSHPHPTNIQQHLLTPSESHSLPTGVPAPQKTLPSVTHDLQQPPSSLSTAIQPPNAPNVSVPVLEQLVTHGLQQPPSLCTTIHPPNNVATPVLEQPQSLSSRAVRFHSSENLPSSTSDLPVQQDNNQFVTPSGQPIQVVHTSSHPVHLNGQYVSQHTSLSVDQNQINEFNNWSGSQHGPQQLKSIVSPMSAEVPPDQVTTAAMNVTPSIPSPNPAHESQQAHFQIDLRSSGQSQTQTQSQAAPISSTNDPTSDISSQPGVVHAGSFNSVDVPVTQPTPDVPVTSAVPPTNQHVSQQRIPPPSTHSNDVGHVIDSEYPASVFPPSILIPSDEGAGDLPQLALAPIIENPATTTDPSDPNTVPNLGNVHGADVASETVVVEPNHPVFKPHDVTIRPESNNIPCDQNQAMSGEPVDNSLNINIGHRTTSEACLRIQPHGSQVPHSASDSQIRNTNNNNHIGATELPPRPPSTPITPDTTRGGDAIDMANNPSSDISSTPFQSELESRPPHAPGLVQISDSVASELNQGNNSRSSSLSIPKIVVVSNDMTADGSKERRKNGNGAVHAPLEALVEAPQTTNSAGRREQAKNHDMTASNISSPPKRQSRPPGQVYMNDGKAAGRISPEHPTPTSGQMRGTSWRSAQSVDTTATASSKERRSNGGEMKRDKFLTKCFRLMDFCGRGRYEDAKNSLLNGASAKFQDYDRRTPLHICACDGHLALCSLLIEHGADVSAKDRWGNTALSDAVENDRDKVIELLKQFGAEDEEIDIENLELLHYCATGNIDAVRRRITGGAEASFCDYDKRTPLHLACSEGHAEVVEILLTNGASYDVLDRKKRTPVQDAISNGRRNVLRLLARHGAKIPEHMYLANDEHVARLGMELMSKCAKGELGEVQAYLDEGLDANFRDYDGRTPMHLACVEGHEDVARLLIQYGAKLDVRDRWLSLPLDEAISSKYEPMAHRIREFENRYRNEGEAVDSELIMTDTNGHGGHSSELGFRHFPGRMSSMQSLHFSTDDFAAKPSLNTSGSGNMDDLQQPSASITVTCFDGGNDAEGSGQAKTNLQQENVGGQAVDYAEGDRSGSSGNRVNSNQYGWAMEGDMRAYGVAQMNDNFVVEAEDVSRHPIDDGGLGWNMSGMPPLVEQMDLSGENARDMRQVAYSSSMVSLSSGSNGITDGNVAGSAARETQIRTQSFPNAARTNHIRTAPSPNSSGPPIQVIRAYSMDGTDGRVVSGRRRQEVSVEMRRLVEHLVDNAVRKN